MQTFDERPVDALVWFQPERMKQRFELRRDQAVVATLTFEPFPTFGWGRRAQRSALAETDGGKWKLSVVRSGFLGMKGTVGVEGTNAGALPVGYFLLRGTLTISGMEDYQWVGGFAKYGTDVFKDLQGFPVVSMDHGSIFERINARVSVSAGATTARDIALLASIGLYMRMLMDKVY